MVHNPPVAWPARTAVKERNRDALLAAVRELAAESGYAGTSVDAVARRAGLTKGAVYSIFGSKAELFLSLLTPQWGVFPLRSVAAPEDGLPAALAAYGRQWAALVSAPEAERAVRLVLELYLEASRQPEVLARLRDTVASGTALLAAELQEFADAEGRVLRRGHDCLAEALIALLQGLSQQAATGLGAPDPDLYAAAAVALLEMA